jgi:ISXO2-like transposase domain
MARPLGITQKSAWFVNHRIRLAMQTGTFLYMHETVDYAEKYVEGKIHINGTENFWALLKRGLHGTYVHAAPFHLFRYLDERVFTFNERDLDDLGRFLAVVSTVAGRRLTYAGLTRKSDARAAS